MRNLNKILTVVGVGGLALLVDQAAYAQATATGAVGTPANVDITITGIVTSAVQLTVAGAGGTALSGVLGNTGTLDFGTFSAVNPGAASNTVFAGRVPDGGGAASGGLVAARLTATVTFNGVPTGVAMPPMVAP